MRQIIGLIGRIASGKSLVADYLVERKYNYYRFSDVLEDILERLYEPNTRENLQNLGLALRKLFDDNILAETIRRDIIDDKPELVVIDGIRYSDELGMVKALGGTVIYIRAPQEIRYQRVVERATRGEAGITLEKFKKNEEKETEKLIDELGLKADYILDNTGSVDELKRKLDKILES